MTRSELIVALLDMEPTDEDIWFTVSEGFGEYRTYRIEATGSYEPPYDSFSKRAVFILKEV